MTQARYINKELGIYLEVDEKNRVAVDKSTGVKLTHDAAVGGNAVLETGRIIAHQPNIYPIGHPRYEVEVPVNERVGTLTHEPGSVQVVRPGEENRLWNEIGAAGGTF